MIHYILETESRSIILETEPQNISRYIRGRVVFLAVAISHL